MKKRLDKEEINLIINDLQSIISTHDFVLLNTNKSFGYYNIIINPTQTESHIESTVFTNKSSKYDILKLSRDKIYELLLSRDDLFAKYISDYIVLKDKDMLFYRIYPYLLAIQKSRYN